MTPGAIITILALVIFAGAVLRGLWNEHAHRMPRSVRCWLVEDLYDHSEDGR